MRFQSETSVFKFLGRSEVWALVIVNTSMYVLAKKARKPLTSSWIKVSISATCKNSDSTCLQVTKRFYSCGQNPCKFIKTKGIVYIRKEFDYHIKPLLSREKFPFLVLALNTIILQHLIIHFPLYYLSSGRLREVKNKRKFQPLSCKSGQINISI